MTQTAILANSGVTVVFMGLWGRLSRAIGFTEEPPQVPPGVRVYAIGDVHGRLDLVNELLALIEREQGLTSASRSILVFVGDLVDRGPDSAGVVDRLRTLALPNVALHFLMGNHEEALLRVLAAEGGWLPAWLRFGGDACAASYGVPLSKLERASEELGAAMLARCIPPTHVAFMRSFQDSVTIGDYVFVHAGIRPGIPISDQTRDDLRWIREPFLSDIKTHSFVVVHGHTVVDTPQDRGNRIGIDTGAFRSGRLTALVLEGTTRRYLVTGSTCCG